MLGQSFQNLSAGSSVTFRFYGFEAEATTGTWRLDSIRVYGSIVQSGTPDTGGVPFTRTIAQVRGQNTGGQADSVGRNVRLFGTVYGVNQRLSAPTGGYQMFIRDATGGIGIFKNAPVSGINNLNEGDSVKVMGRISVFRGLSQIEPDSMVVLATGRPIKDPVVVSALNENTEADLVRLNDVTLVNPSPWTGTGTGFTVQVSNANGTYDVRIDDDCPLYGQPAPTGTFSIIGMGSQFAPSTTAPFTGGYQIIPRRLTDLINITGENKPVKQKEIILWPNPTHDRVFLSGIQSIEELAIFNQFGRQISTEGRWNGDALSLYDLPIGVYFVKLTKSAKVLKVIKQ